MTDNLTRKGSGRWFIPVSISIILIVIFDLFFIAFTANLLKNLWFGLIKFTSEFYNPNLIWILPVVIGINMVIVFLSFYLLYLFFNKNCKFFYFIIGYQAILIIFIVFDQYISYLYAKLPIGSYNIFNILKTISFAIILIANILRTKRVAITLVKEQRASYNNVIS